MMPYPFRRDRRGPAGSRSVGLRSGLLSLLLLCAGLDAGAGSAATATPQTQTSNSWPAFQKLVTDAESASAAQRWPEAARLWAAVTVRNPVTPNYWLALARARYRSDSLEAALPAYRRAFSLGAGRPAEVALVIARCHARLARPDSAWTWLDRALDLGYRDNETLARDPMFSALHDDPRFRARLGWFDAAALERVAGWRHDLAYLRHEAHRRLWRLPARTATEFDAAAARLDAAIPRLDDMAVEIELMKLVRRLGDGHTTVFGFDERAEFRACVPVEFEQFEDGLFITGSTSARAGLIGRKVLRIEGRAPEVVLDSLDAIISRDNPQARLVMGLRRLRCLPLLKTLGLIGSPEQVELQLADEGGRISTITLHADATLPSLWHHRPEGWTRLADRLPATRAASLTHPERPYWFTLLPGTSTLYFQWNRIADDPAGSWAPFVDSLLAAARAARPDRFIVDLRFNHGGDTGLEAALLEPLMADAAVNREGHLFVLIGRQTFSAAQNAANFLRRYTQATFVGEPTGSRPNFVGEEAIFPLPWSRLLLNISDRYWQGGWPTDASVWIPPLIYVAPTMAALRAGRDEALEAILGLP